MRSHDLTHQVDLQSFLTMTNSDLEEVGITDPEEKLYILDAIYEIKVLIQFLMENQTTIQLWSPGLLKMCSPAYFAWTLGNGPTECNRLIIRWLIPRCLLHNFSVHSIYYMFLKLFLGPREGFCLYKNNLFLLKLLLAIFFFYRIK